MDRDSPHPRRRRWLRFSLSTFLIVVTILCVYLGWRFRVTAEEIALREVRPELDGVFYAWQQPELKMMSPVRAEYEQTRTLPDGTKRVETRYHNHPYLLIPVAKATPPKSDLIDRWLVRSPRVHVYGVLLPDYNVNDENLARLKQMPYLRYVVVRNVHESEDGPEHPKLTAVRRALPSAEVVGEIWKLHPKNRK